MRRRLVGVTLAVAAAFAVAAPTALADGLNSYRVGKSAENKQGLTAAGFDMHEADRGSYFEIIRDGRAGARVAFRRHHRAAARRPQGGRRGRRAVHRQRRGLGRLDAATTRSRATTRSSTSSCTTGSRAEHGSRRSRSARRTSAATSGRVKVTKNAKTTTDGHAPGGALQRPAARPRVAGGRDLQAHAEVLRRQLRHGHRGGRDRHAARRHARAVVRLHLQPGRLRVHVHRGQPAVAQEHGRQQRRRRARRAGRRRRPEPQLPDELGPRQRGLLGRSVRRDLPRHRAGLRARDEGDAAALEPRRLRVPEERPHRGRAAALSARLPAVHVDAGQRHLRGARR